MRSSDPLSDVADSRILMKISELNLVETEPYFCMFDGKKANDLRGLDLCVAEIGIAMKVVWKPKNERQGTVTDWHIEHIDGWKPELMTPEKDWMKKHCAPVYEWVKTMN